MKKLAKIEMNHEDLIFGIHKSLSANYLLEEQNLQEAKRRLVFALETFHDFFKQEDSLNLIPIAYEIISEMSHEEGDNWEATLQKEVVIVRQLVPLREYAHLVAEALHVLELWNDKEYAQKQLQSAIETLSYEIVTLSL